MQDIFFFLICKNLFEYMYIYFLKEFVEKNTLFYDILCIFVKDHWWQVENSVGEVGFIPSNYVKKFDDLGLTSFDW